VRCVAHSLQLVVNDVLKEPVAERAKNATQAMTTHFRLSGKALRKLKKLQKENGVSTPLGALRITPTRWNSTFRAIVRLLELKTYVITTMSSPDCPHCSRAISEEDWMSMALLSKLLKPFAVATDHMQMDNASLASVNIEMQRIVDQMTTFAHGDDKVLAQLALTAVESSIVNRWEGNFNSGVVLAATALDPWLRKKVSSHGEWRAKAKEFIRKQALLYLNQFDDRRNSTICA